MKKINIYACICYLNDLLEIRYTSAAVSASLNALDFRKSWEI